MCTIYLLKQVLSERPCSRYEDSIKIHIRETGYEIRNSIEEAEDKVQWWIFVNTVMNLRVPEKKNREFIDKLNDHKRFCDDPAPLIWFLFVFVVSEYSLPADTCNILHQYL